MARQTRAERKARRAEQVENGVAPRGRSRQGADVRPSSEIASREAASREAASAPVREERRRGSFIAESWAELQKVEWPGQRQVMQGTVVVLIACIIVGVYLWGADLVLKRFVQNVLLGQ